MTTLTAASSPDLDGSPSWLRIIALYGVGPALAFVLVLWLTRSVDAKLQHLEAAQADLEKNQASANALIQQHITATHDVLERMARQLEINCKVSVRRDAQSLCEVR
jgi:hypothetical protein